MTEQATPTQKKATALRVVTNSRPMEHTRGPIHPMGTYYTRAERKPSFWRKLMRNEGRKDADQ